MSESVLVLNTGSSSVKYELIDLSDEHTIASGLVERVGASGSQIHHRDEHGATETMPVDAPDHAAAVQAVITAFATNGPDLTQANVVAVGHRVVMGGAAFHSPVVITDQVVETIEQLAPLAPLHNPANAASIRIARELLGSVPHVAVFDTAFFHNLPEVAARYAIDAELADRHAIRRYGFHGISHEYVSAKVAALLRPGGSTTEATAPLRQVVLHLGNGASASAVVDGRAVDTSMGFTPLEGLIMGTRSGDIDPSVAFYLYRNVGMSIDEVDHLLNHGSGMQGLAGSNDLRDIHTGIADGKPEAELALAMYVARIRKYIGSYAAVMGGLDAVTFTAGVGENDPVVRELVTDGLGFLGIELDQALNIAGSHQSPERAQPPERARPTECSGVRSDVPMRSQPPEHSDVRLISRAASKVAVLVVPTHEELSIARQTAALILKPL